jgi:phage baseplate assembly protein gpV
MVLAGTGLLAACGDDPSVAEERAAQVREAASEAGLPDEVVEVLVLAARGSLATFRVTYPGTEGAQVVVAQAPPDQRVDIVAAGTVVESRVLRDGIAHQCRLDDGGRLRCERAAGGLEVPGAFTEEALDAFTEQLAASVDAVELRVEERTIADTDATCLVSAPKAGTPLDGSEPANDALCLSPEGAQLLLDAGGERLVADSYSTDVPEGTFDV